MINLKVGDIDCKIPSAWNEITLADYSKIYGIIKANEFVEPKVENEFPSDEESKALESERALHNVKTNRKVFAEMTGIDEQTINRVDGNEMAETLLLMTNFLNGDVERMEIKDGVANSFKYKGKKYFFPIAEMKDSTFGDFIEAAQLDMLAQQNEAGKFGVMAEQMAILCREQGEDYDEKIVIKKTKLFQGLTMDVVWNFVFFLKKQISLFKTNIPTSLRMETEMITDTQQSILK